MRLTNRMFICVSNIFINTSTTGIKIKEKQFVQLQVFTLLEKYIY